jgi:alpha-glucosidase
MNDFLWWRDGVIYQIYPRSFADGDNDGLGDLAGITSKLDYLADLGIDAIWLSPIYPSPDKDFGYDVSNYVDVDPRFGTLADFDKLVAEAHKRNIKVILDLVLNHTSDQHDWFKESRSSRDNPKRDWYLWRDPLPGGKKPNNWGSIFGGSGWELDPATGQYYFHMFVKEQPDVNWRNPEVRQEMLNVFRFWLERGVDGFRLDVFNAYFKHPELADNPPKFGLRKFDRQKHINDIAQPEMMPLLQEVRAILDSYNERYAVGETFLVPPESAASYCGDDKLHAAFNFDFLFRRWGGKNFLDSINMWEKALGKQAWPNYVLSNHDQPRTATRYCKGEDDARAKVALGMLLTLRGTPFIYYGEEIGLRDVSLSRSEIMDPVGKYYWPIVKGRDGCRSPMQWNAGTNAGFSTAKPWLKVHSNYTQRNVAAQKADPASLLNFTRRLIVLRKENMALRHGDFTALAATSQNMLAYVRKTPEQSVLVALNFSDRLLSLDIPAGKWQQLLSTHGEHPLTTTKLELAPYEVCILADER